MPHFYRTIFVVPLIVTTCAVAVLNGGVLCMAGGDHFAVEAKHEPGGCHDGESPTGHDHADPHDEPCSDVAAELDLLRAGSRSTVDAGSLVAPCLWAVVPSGQCLMRFAVAPPVGSTSAPPSSTPLLVTDSVILII